MLCKSVFILSLCLVSAFMLSAVTGPVTVYAQESEQKLSPEAEKAIQAISAKVDAATAANDALKSYTRNKLLALCGNKVFVDAVKTQNDKGVALDEIKKLDTQWSEAEEQLEIQKELLGNACALEIKKQIKLLPEITEVFVMDNQGAVVGENSLTSDYWQGDEEKWTNSYNKGKGGVDVGKAKFDKSANAQLQQVSLPIIDAAGKVIGAITWGVAVDKI